MNILFNALSQSRDSQLLNTLTKAGIKDQLKTTGKILLGSSALHTAAMVAFEGMSLGDAAWLTATTIVTVGYGDLSAATDAGRLSTVLLGYGLGTTSFAQGAGLYLDYRRIRLNEILNGKWKWKMKDHTVFLNVPKNNPEGYFDTLMTEFRKSALPQAQAKALVVSPDIPNEAATVLHEHAMAHISHPVSSKKAFDNSSLSKAGTVVVLSPDENLSLIHI